MNPIKLLLVAPGVLWALPGAAQVAKTSFVSFDPSTKTVSVTLGAGAPGKAGPFNFNGFAAGGATLVVPPGGTVVMNFVNLDGVPHSAEIIADKDPMPNEGVAPAITYAYTNGLLEGLPQGGKDTMRFTAPESGSFRIFCGVPGHGVSGMWIRFKVDPGASAPAWLTP